MKKGSQVTNQCVQRGSGEEKVMMVESFQMDECGEEEQTVQKREGRFQNDTPGFLLGVSMETETLFINDTGGDVFADRAGKTVGNVEMRHDVFGMFQSEQD